MIGSTLVRMMAMIGTPPVLDTALPFIDAIPWKRGGSYFFFARGVNRLT